jgi:hypothetical protein
VGTHDWEEECEDEHNSNKGFGSFHMLKESFVEETQYIQIGLRDLLKLKKVAMSNIMCLNLTLIVV